MAGAYANDAKDIIGEKAWTEIVSAAAGGHIDAQQMKDVSRDLPTDRKDKMKRNKIGGEHTRRMSEKDTSPNEAEMKNILSDWFLYGEMPKDRAKALEVLIKVFKTNGNNPLAGKLEEIKDNPKQVYNKSMKVKTPTI